METLRIRWPLPTQAGPGTTVTISVRPEDVQVLPGAQEGDNRFRGTVSFVRDVGASVETYVDCDGVTIVSHAVPKDRPAVSQGDAATVELPREACVVLPA